MTEDIARRPSPRVLVIADVESNAQALVKRILAPAGFQASAEAPKSGKPDVLVVDVTQLRGDPLAGLRARRESGDETPAVVLAAHFPASRLRDLFRLGVSDILLKPYRPEDLCQAIAELGAGATAEPDAEAMARKLEGLREQLRRRTEEIRLLSEIGRAVVSLGDLDPILTRVAEAAAFMTEAEEANLYLAEPGTNELVLRASKQAGEKHATLQRLRVFDTLVGQVFQKGEPLLHQPSIKGDAVKVQTGFMVQSMIQVPLRMGRKVVGVMGVYNRLAPRAFSDYQLVLMMALADWAGVALENASLILKTKTSSGASGPLTVAPTGMLDGLKKALSGVEDILDGDAASLTDSQRLRLSAVRATLHGLSSMPVAVLDKERAEGLLDLPGLVRELIGEMQPEAARIGIELEVEPGSAMPHFPADKARVAQVVEALVNASARRLDRGRLRLRVDQFTVKLGRAQGIALPPEVGLEDGTWAAVSLVDGGPPLSADLIRALTSQAPDPSAGQTGPGLTLGETRMIAESLGGMLWYVQAQGTTRLTFALPVG
jgi:DNA-binding NarL/FixJ family response regulator